MRISGCCPNIHEATAFADPENEALIQRAFGVLTKGKTVLMIAHRLSTVRDADNILVLDEGVLRESGSHDTLLAQNGLYAEMWRDYQKAASWKVGAALVTEMQGGPQAKTEREATV